MSFQLSVVYLSQKNLIMADKSLCKRWNRKEFFTEDMINALLTLFSYYRKTLKKIIQKQEQMEYQAKS